MLRSAASLVLSVLIVASCATSSPSRTVAAASPGASPNGAASATPGPTARATADQVPSPTLSPSPLATPTPEPVATPTDSPVATLAPTPSPAPTPLPGHLVVDAQLVGPGIGWVETDRALLVTYDDGHSWRDATPVGRRPTYGLAALDGQSAYVASDETGASDITVKIWRTWDGGLNWHGTKLASVPPEANQDCGCVHHGVLIDAVSPLVVFVDVVNTGGVDDEGHQVFRSLDGGVSWKPMPLTIQAQGAPADLAIHFLTADVGTVLFDERLFSTDSGWGHWTELDQGGRVPGPGPVTFLDGRHWITAGRLQYLDGTVPFAESVDAGRTWTVRTRTVPVTPGEGLDTAFEFIDSTTWVAVLATHRPAETWISTDAGKTWSFVGNQPTSDPRRSTFTDRFHAWVRDDAGGLATTSDGGATWAQIGP